MEEERKFNSEDEDIPRTLCPSCHGSRINRLDLCAVHMECIVD